MQIDTNKDTINEANVGIQIQKLIFILYSIFFMYLFIKRDISCAYNTILYLYGALHQFYMQPYISQNWACMNIYRCTLLHGSF